MTNVIIRFKNVKKSFGHNEVLKGIDLDIVRGDIFGIIGTSGSGKTTILNTLIGFLPPDEGDVMFQITHLLDDGGESQLYSVFNRNEDVQKTFGFAAQTPSFYDKLTIKENLDYFGALYGLSTYARKTNTNTILRLMALLEFENSLAMNLSGGMQKRLDIACALIHDPAVLILDEPTADLDPILRKQMWELLKKINKRGTTIIISSHFLQEIETHCTRIGMLHNGTLINIGSPSKLKDMHSQNEEIHLESSPGKYEPLITKLKKTGAKKIVNKGHKLIIYTTKAESVLHHILHYLEENNEVLLDVEVNKPNLNEIFEELETNENRKDNSEGS